MAQIWKYALQPTGRQEVVMPKGSSILSVQEQHGQLNLWALVDPVATPEARTLLMIGTGHEFQAALLGPFVGTVQMLQGDLVLHLFEVA